MREAALFALAIDEGGFEVNVTVGVARVASPPALARHPRLYNPRGGNLRKRR